MDKRERAINVVKALNEYKDDKQKDFILVEKVCAYFDLIKDNELSQADLQFLKYISNAAGIPQYFDNLKNFQSSPHNIKDVTLTSLSSLIYESTLHTNDNNKVHKYQKKILDNFKTDKQNRYFLSASTSFGKTHLVYEIIQKMKYRNIVLIFPTIALLSENLEKLLERAEYEGYTLHTLSDVPEEQISERNIFIYTPERFLSFIEKHQNKYKFDFIFIDEVYKIDNEYIIDDEEARESERDVSYRIAAFYSIMQSADVLMAGPYIEKYSESFERFLDHNQIIKLEFNQYEIVGKSYHNIKAARKNKIDEILSIDFGKGKTSKYEKVGRIVSTICNIKENCIIYCSTKRFTEKYAEQLPVLTKLSKKDGYISFYNHVKLEYGEDWVVTKALEKGVGIHHGLVPKYMQKEIIRFFNDGIIKVLTSTTTITEGVNTSAKNLIVTNNKKGDKSLKRFDAKNIAGRAGRFDRHYSGRVIVMQNDFMKDINKENESINHKNYDSGSKKDEIDLFYSKEEFLSSDDKIKKENIKLRQDKLGISDEIFYMYKVVSRKDKMDIYESILKFKPSEHAAIRKLKQAINNPNKLGIDQDGFQVILNCLEGIIKNSKLLFLIGRRREYSGHIARSALTTMVSSYLKGGFKELIKYNKENRKQDTDDAMRDATEFVYNTLKYQLVKYLGVFNIMYKFYLSQETNKEFEEVQCIDKLLTKLEYNALSEIGRKVSDYGVPDKILKYYEEANKANATLVRSQFDSYERDVFDRIQKIISDS